jgi:hypothetical protein
VLLAIVCDVKGRSAPVWNYLLQISGIVWRLVEFHFRAPVPEKPTARIVGFVHRDPVDPGFERTLSAEATDVAEDLQEDLLDHVAGLALIV